MVEVIWTDPALSDLDDIAEYLALENTAVAKIIKNSRHCADMQTSLLEYYI